MSIFTAAFIVLAVFAARFLWANEVTCRGRLKIIDALHTASWPRGPESSYSNVSYDQHLKAVFLGADPLLLYSSELAALVRLAKGEVSA